MKTVSSFDPFSIITTVIPKIVNKTSKQQQITQEIPITPTTTETFITTDIIINNMTYATNGIINNTLSPQTCITTILLPETNLNNVARNKNSIIDKEMINNIGKSSSSNESTTTFSIVINSMESNKSIIHLN